MFSGRPRVGQVKWFKLAPTCPTAGTCATGTKELVLIGAYNSAGTKNQVQALSNTCTGTGIGTSIGIVTGTYTYPITYKYNLVSGLTLPPPTQTQASITYTSTGVGIGTVTKALFNIGNISIINNTSSTYAHVLAQELVAFFIARLSFSQIKS